MKRSLLVMVLLMAVLAMTASPASAAVSALEFEDGSCGGPCVGGTVVSMEGTITCTAGQEYFIRASGQQNGKTFAVGRASGVCTGSSQIWETNRVDNPGTLQCGSFVGRAQARTATGKRFDSTPFGDLCF